MCAINVDAESAGGSRNVENVAANVLMPSGGSICIESLLDVSVAHCFGLQVNLKPQENYVVIIRNRLVNILAHRRCSVREKYLRDRLEEGETFTLANVRRMVGSARHIVSASISGIPIDETAPYLSLC